MNKKYFTKIIFIYSISILLYHTGFSQDLMLTPRIPVQQTPFHSTKAEKNETTNIEDFTTQKSYLKSIQSDNLIYDWGKHLSTEYDDRYYDIVIDDLGNIIVGGLKV
jgi:hypothetical protein